MSHRLLRFALRAGGIVLTLGSAALGAAGADAFSRFDRDRDGHRRGVTQRKDNHGGVEAEAGRERRHTTSGETHGRTHR